MDEEQLIERMNAIRNASERHVSQMHLEAERLVDWREHVRAQPLPALALAVAAGFWLVYRKPAAHPATQRAAASSPVSSSTESSGADKQSAQRQDLATRTTFASGAMAFVGTMAGNLLKQYVSNYVQQKLAGVQHDRNATARGKTDEEYAVRESSRW